MKNLFKSKIYIRSFTLYMCVLLLLLTMIGIVLEKSILNDSLMGYEYKASECFGRMEEKVDNTVSDIDGYMMNLYLNSVMLSDFMNFLGSNAEEYQTTRLLKESSGETGMSFVDGMLKFLADEEYHIKKVLFVTDGRISLLTIGNQGTAFFDFDIDKSEYRSILDETSGDYVYSKVLRKNDMMSELIGTMIFIIDKSYLYSNASPDYDDITVTEGSGKTVSIITGEKVDNTSVDINASGGRDTFGRYSIFKREYRFSFVSTSRNIKISFIMTKGAVLKANLLSLTILFSLITVSFVVMMILIGMHMKRESDYLNTIITSIQTAHNGNFVHINTLGRHDEYSMIANEFNSMVDELDKFIEKEYKFTIKQQETQMKALLYQINPHFLFNTLEMIKANAVENHDDETADALLYLGKLYRMLVKEPDVITFSKEKEMVEYYLKLMEFRYKDKFCYQIDIEDEVLEKNTIKFWLQPLAENFFLHGFDNSNEFNLLIINGKMTQAGFRIEIIDNGHGTDSRTIEDLNRKLASKEEISMGGIGIGNVVSRLRFYYGDNCQMKLKNSEVRGLTITVDIFEGSGDEACTD